MTVSVKEMYGARSVEVELKEGVLYFDDGRYCHGFDVRIFLRALEREAGIAVRDAAEVALLPCQGYLSECHSPAVMALHG